jgi:hypothetical protein
MNTRTLDVNGLDVLWVEVKGTYEASPMMSGSAEPNPGYMLLGAIARGPDVNWFFKLTGPEATVEANRSAFDAMVQSMQTVEQAASDQLDRHFLRQVMLRPLARQIFSFNGYVLAKWASNKIIILSSTRPNIPGSLSFVYKIYIIMKT